MFQWECVVGDGFIRAVDHRAIPSQDLDRDNVLFKRTTLREALQGLGALRRELIVVVSLL